MTLRCDLLLTYLAVSAMLAIFTCGTHAEIQVVKAKKEAQRIEREAARNGSAFTPWKKNKVTGMWVPAD